MGGKTLATCSDGTGFPNVKAYRRSKRKLAYLQRSLSRKQKGSSNRKKALKALSKLCYRISCIRKDAVHKLTSWLDKNPSVIVLEDLNVNGMLKNHRLTNAAADCGFYELRRQLACKADLYGSSFILADRFYPSTP